MKRQIHHRSGYWSQRRRGRFLELALAAGLAAVAALVSAAPEPGRAPGAPAAAPGPFQPSWESLAQYRCPDWFRDAKFGIWARWDAQSVPEQGDGYAQDIYEDDTPEYRYHLQHYGHPSQVGFKEINHLWRAEHWNPQRLMQLYQRAGAHYFVALANDYDNFDCFDSRYQPWNSVHIGPKKDIVGTWARAARQAGLRFGVSVHAARAWSWFARAQRADDEGPREGVPYDGRLTRADGKGKWWEGYDPQDLYAQNHRPGAKPDRAYLEKFRIRVQDLIERYHPDLLSFDDRGMPLQEVGNVGLRLAAYYYNQDMRRHGGVLQAVADTKALSAEQRRGMVLDIERGIADQIEPYPWQTETSIGSSWQYQRTLFEHHRYKTPEKVIHMLADVVSKNGNLLLNLPLRGDGTLDADEEAFLQAMARWMRVNGEAIFGTRPWNQYGEGPVAEAPAPPFISQNERILRPFTSEEIRFTVKGRSLYAIVGRWPESRTLVIKALRAGSPLASGKVSNVRLLGHQGSLEWTQSERGLTIALPAQKPCDYAFAIKVEGVVR